MSALLEIKGLSVRYGAVPACREVDLEVNQGEVVVVLGANGAGKSTIIRSIMGLTRPSAGRITFAGNDLTGKRPHVIHSTGIAWVPEGREVWASLTVMENLRLGIGKHRAEMDELIESMFDRFPRLRERQNQSAGSLSGGEQQMVAIARALMSRPSLLLMDEPSLGLAPLIVRDVFSLIKELNGDGISILLVEQNARQALNVADRGYLLSTGQIVASGDARDLEKSEDVQTAFLGGSSH